jgi:hypothetical protein
VPVLDAIAGRTDDDPSDQNRPNNSQRYVNR